MFFRNWLKRNASPKSFQGGYIHRDKLIDYLKNKKRPLAKQIIEDLEDSPDVLWIPIALFEDKDYNVKF